MKSRQTRKRNSQRKIRMSRKHQGGDMPLQNEPVQNESVQNTLAIIEQGMHDEGEKMIVTIGLNNTIKQLQELVKNNKNDNSTNKINIDAGKPGENAIISIDPKMIITIQEKLIEEYTNRLNITNLNTK